MKKTFTGFILAIVIGLTLSVSPAVVAQVGTAVKNGFAACQGVNCDNTLTVGGTMAVSSAATVTGLVIAPSNATYKIARGTVTLDGSNPSSATTGLATAVACTVTNKRSTAPGLDPTEFTIITTAVAGRLDVYAWKPTGATDTTLVASTDADDTIDWVCVGT